MSFVKTVIFIVIFIQTVSTKSLPSYLKPCSRSDPDLNGCISKHANLAFPQLVKGDRKYRIPGLNPLEITEVITEPGPNLKVTLRNLKSYGTNKATVLDSKLDFKNATLSMKVRLPALMILADYEMKGRILILPIEGTGNCNITYVGAIFDYDMVFDYVTRKDNKVYLRIKDYEMKFEPDRTIYNFENLFNGDQRLGKQMNEFLNENWRELHKDMGASIGQTMGTVTSSILNSIFNVVPYDDMFLP